VEALYDREAGHRAVLRNLLQREGYEGIEAIREEGREAGREEGRSEGIAQSILTLLGGRGLPIDQATRGRILACQDRQQLNAWLLAAARVEAARQIFD
jgi:predicted transposase YdaD